MAMKKKFLGLAMAAAIALPVALPNAAYANGTTGTNQDLQTITSERDDVEVEVTGTVDTKAGNKPEKIEVVLPSKLAFSVDKDGKFTGTDFVIDNNSTNVDIDVSVAQFKGGTTLSNGSGDGIEVRPATDFAAEPSGETAEDKAAKLYRNQISLTLSKISNSNEVLDLGNFSSATATEKKLGTIRSGQEATVYLRGNAGTKTVDDLNKTENDVDTKGAEQKFTIVFSIAKAPKVPGSGA